jgi:ubiquinone/menaquinone biosynthesis C-methylase UbiE
MERPVRPEDYTREYFLTHCQGWEEYQKDGANKELPHRLEKALVLANLEPDYRVLDIGCGRGEIVVRTKKIGCASFGIDYSKAALEICREFSAKSSLEGSMFLLADLKWLPFSDESFDRVFMLDVAEHLRSWELDRCLCEVYRTLKPSGCLIVHTNPNRWREYILPIKKLFGCLFKIDVPEKENDPYCSKVHVNEQSPLGLRKAIKKAGYDTKVWVESPEIDVLKEKSHLVWTVLDFIVNKTPLKFLGNDIWALGYKR